MKCSAYFRILAPLVLLAPFFSVAQTSTNKAIENVACEAKPGASAWLPCGPDRVLGEADIKAYVIKEGFATKMIIKGGASGNAFFANFFPGGKFEAGKEGSTNIGKGWSMNGNKVCRAYYRPINDDNSANPITSMELVKQ
jgi:hypothetical protein